MKLDIFTLIVVLSLTLGTQVIALSLQHRINKTYRGIGYWLVGSSLIAIGFILMPMVNVESLQIFARMANPLLILGHIFFYVGSKKFLDKKLNKWIPILTFLVFNLFYYYYMYINNSISARTFIISFTIAFISFAIAYELFFEEERIIYSAAKFTAAIFTLYGLFHIGRAFHISLIPAVNLYVDQSLNLIITFSISILLSNLWTFGLIIMVNQRLNIENNLEKEKLQLIFNTNIDAQLITRLDDGFIVDVNDEFSVLSGYSKSEVIGSYSKDINFWHNSEDRRRFTAELSDKGSCHNMEFAFQQKNGGQFPGIISARIIPIHSTIHAISVIRDITERKEFEDALIESEEKYRSILNASPDDITITDLEGRILMISPAAKEMFGYELEFDNFIGMQLLDFIIAEDVERAKFNILQMHEGVTGNTNEYRGLRKDKSIFDVEVNSGFIYNANGIPHKMVFIIRDVTKRKLIESEMQKLVQQLEIEKSTAEFNSITDSLTGLYNRRYFDEVLRTEFSRLTRSGSTLTLIMLDIDHFKKFNDSYGHLAGDKCIQMIASTLKACVERPSDIAARYGGEEFIVILPDTDENGAKVLGERFRKRIEDLAIPHVASDTSKYVTVSLGTITIHPGDLPSVDRALKLVDEALYQAKGKGRNSCVFRSSRETSNNIFV